MKIEKTSLEGVLLIKPELIQDGKGEFFSDARGGFLEAYNAEKYANGGIKIPFVEDDISISRKDVLRGMHGDDRTWKLVSCLYGKMFFAVIDADRKSPAFGKWESVELNEENHWRMLVPPKHAIGYVALTDKIIVSYKQSEYYKPGTQFTLRWDDPKFNIPWPIKNPIVSARDAEAKFIDA